MILCSRRFFFYIHFHKWISICLFSWLIVIEFDFVWFEDLLGGQTLKGRFTLFEVFLKTTKIVSEVNI